MLRQSVETWIKARLVEASNGRLPAESIQASTLLRQDLGMTSLLAVTVMLDVEEQFGIEVSDEDLTRLGTVGDVIAMVLNKLSPLATGTE
jgi:acyl carrier protein